MQTFLHRCAVANNNFLVRTWQCISLLALDPDALLATAGPAQAWFVKEDARNPGANYLFGLLQVLAENGGAHHFEATPEDLRERFNALLQTITQRKSPNFWQAQHLRTCPDWAALRQLAQRLLDENGLWPNLPAKPFHLPDHIEIWWGKG